MLSPLPQGPSSRDGRVFFSRRLAARISSGDAGHGVLATGTVPRGSCRRDLVAATLSRGSCKSEERPCPTSSRPCPSDVVKVYMFSPIRFRQARDPAAHRHQDRVGRLAQPQGGALLFSTRRRRGARGRRRRLPSEKRPSETPVAQFAPHFRRFVERSPSLVCLCGQTRLPKVGFGPRPGPAGRRVGQNAQTRQARPAGLEGKPAPAPVLAIKMA
ncbi:hypothetical protein M885DRAFT_503903 [Pelagophyceae sp. CCMP2097]|nr:hypothetical protein M885DRAFT_503903 [Pelagophyceae sp. CCMP2097]|mmetsp:Transcript_28842/g.99526  ORF Transcript_28842/g.99526 Transcript_28842/m.99526 type:complete len:215 (+) Transcript_28842:1720-2364(+)